MIVALLQILALAANLLVTIIIVSFILNLLIIFNVVSPHNQYVSALLTALNALLDPVLRPIRRILPDTGMIDFSPIILIFGIQVLMIILQSIASAAP
jgi:YggT family protein